MDDLLAKLRSTQSEPPRKRDLKTLHAEIDVIERINESIKNASDEEEINVCDSEADLSNVGPFKMDFERLERHRKGEYMNAIEIKGSTEYKIALPFYGLIKSIEKFGQNVYKWEMCDETGYICGSVLAQSLAVEIGDIVKLKGCSLWHIDEAHLNIVERNIIEIHKIN
ncbi:hypothetical protein ENBRE01_2775 [Enteropsectra breve]|nr:hypothetical protein ENBRE01_2775 [Enteropsectra breve]